jgi:hypothetical protein
MRRRPDPEENSKLTQFMQGLIEQAEQYIEAEDKKQELTQKIVQVLERNHSARGDDNQLVFDFYKMFERSKVKFTFEQFEAMRSLTRPESIVRIRRFINRDGVLKPDGHREQYLPLPDTVSKRRQKSVIMKRVALGLGV